MTKPGTTVDTSGSERGIAGTSRWCIRPSALYYDESERNVVAIVEARETPSRDLETYATASLHDSANLLDGSDIRIELFMVVCKGQSKAGNLVASAAFFVAKDRWLAAPGVVFPNLITEYFPGADVKHVLWVEPFDFPGLSNFDVDGVDASIHALQGVPITDRELDLFGREGFDALERVLEEADAPYCDMDRGSVV